MGLSYSSLSDQIESRTDPDAKEFLLLLNKRLFPNAPSQFCALYQIDITKRRDALLNISSGFVVNSALRCMCL